MRGLNEEPASWNTSCMRWRAARNSAASISEISISSKRTVPAVGSINRVSSRPVVDLPQPLSPTRASVSPRSMVNDTPSTARTAPTVLWPKKPPAIG